MAVGRISGPLLKKNLTREGVDLAFETDLLYLDVNNGRIGVKTSSPSHTLTINGTSKTTDLEVTTQADLATFTITGNTIASSSDTINLTPSGTDPVVYQGTIVVDDVEITGNTISTTGTNTDLNITTVGTGKVNVNADLEVTGDIHATGTITADGNIQLGNADTDNIVFQGEVNSNIVPDQHNTYKLGTTDKKWQDVYVVNLTADTVTAGGIVVDGIDLALRQGNLFYVSENGNDSNSGTHENDPFLTVSYALSQATSGDTVYIYPGTYSEVFPLTVPAGVVVKGASIRSVTIQPTSGTVTNDAFLLNGDTTIEDLTVTGFRYDAGGDTGYAFRFASNMSVTTRSPYIRNITVITRGSTTSASDPYGFDSNDAGKGVLADGSVVNASSKEASMLFHSVTFITPNQETVSATNGVRIEWLNSFTYFADKGIYAYSGSTGFAGAGKTKLRIDSRTGTWAVGNTVTYYDTDRTTVLASGTIASIDGDYVYLAGKCSGFETITDRSGKTVYANGNAKLSTSFKKFGASSLALDGTGDYANISTNPDFEFGTDDFCIEAWVYPTTTGVYRTLFDLRSSSGDTGGIILGISDANALYFFYNGNYRVGPVGTVAVGAWTHVALARVSGSTKVFVNGTQVGSTYTDSNTYAERAVRIGADPNGNYAFAGYIDDVRISKGVGRYSSNFTAPTAALTGDLSTVLLLHFNGTNNSTIFLDDGVTLQDLRTSASGTASLINFADYSDFGAEIRSIGSANIYGNYGTYGDGEGIVAYLISQNYAYVGSGKLSTNDPNDRIEANEVVKLNDAKIYYTSVDNEGNFSVGDAFYVNQKTGEVLFNNQLLSIVAPDGVVFSDGVNTTTLLPGEVTTGNIKISGNTVESLTGDVNVVSASGAINLQNNTNISGDLDVTGNVTIGGNIQIGDETTDTVSFVAGISSNLVPATTNTYDLGTTDLRWNNLYLSGNFNTAGDVTASGNVTVNGYMQLSSIRISGNTVETTATNTDLKLLANGTGNVVIEGLQVNTNNIQSTGTNADITITPTGTGIVNINSTQSLKIPVGTTLERPGSPTSGMIRYNTTMSRYEGWNGSYWIALGNVQDVDGNTYITPELTPGANDNTIRFYADSNLMVTIDSTKLFAERLQTNNLDIVDNTISAITTNSDINLTTTGTGSVKIGNLAIRNNTISNTVNNAITEFVETGTGYVKVAGTNGVVIPFGDTINRPSVVETGMMRFNTETEIVEIYNGVTWTTVAGTSTGVNFTDATNIGIETALTFG